MDWRLRTKTAPEPPEHTLFDDLKGQAELPGSDITVSNVQFAPYIHFQDDGGKHRLQIREWGAYRLLANPTYASQADALWNAPGYFRNRDMYIVVGNMANHRNNWLVIKTFQPDSTSPTGPTLFDDIPDDASD
jgi:hypothetical protein